MQECPSNPDLQRIAIISPISAIGTTLAHRFPAKRSSIRCTAQTPSVLKGSKQVVSSPLSLRFVRASLSWRWWLGWRAGSCRRRWALCWLGWVGWLWSASSRCYGWLRRGWSRRKGPAPWLGPLAFTTLGFEEGVGRGTPPCLPPEEKLFSGLPQKEIEFSVASDRVLRRDRNCCRPTSEWRAAASPKRKDERWGPTMTLRPVNPTDCRTNK